MTSKEKDLYEDKFKDVHSLIKRIVEITESVHKNISIYGSKKSSNLKWLKKINKR